MYGWVNSILKVSDGSGGHTDWDGKVIASYSETLPSAVPKVSGVAHPLQVYGDSTNALLYFKATVNPGDDIVAGSRLKASYPDVSIFNSNDQVTIKSDTEITDLYIVAIGDATVAATGGQVLDGATEASYRAAFVHYTFNSADNVKTVIISCSGDYNLATPTVLPTTANDVTILVEGKSHA